MLLKYGTQIRMLAGSLTCMDYFAPHGILDLFQEVAGEHSELLDLGYDDLKEKGVTWILVSNKYVLLKNPPMYSTLEVETWPKPKHKFDFYREYRIKNMDGEDIAYGLSRWIIVDTNTKKIIIPRDIEYKGEFYEETNFPDKMEKIKDFDITGLEPYRVKASFSDIDHNMHVNNARYPFYIINAIEEGEIKEFEITYVKEVKLGEYIDIYYIKEGNTYFVKGIVDEKGTCFLSKVKVA